jgi:hypothetical protein
LQCLLLLEQVKLTRLQAQHEQIMIQELNQRAQQNKQMESDKPDGNVVVVVLLTALLSTPISLATPL